MRSLGLIRRRRKPSEALRFLVNFTIFVLVALTVGMGSAWYMIEHGSPLTVRNLGPWTVWTSAGRVDADPYTRAYIARSGRLPVTSNAGRYYFATTDSDGRVIDADCSYDIVGTGPVAEWWSLAAYDGEGALMANPAGRYSVNSSAVLRDNLGVFTITLSRDAHSGNWLPVKSAYRVLLMLRVYQPDYTTDRTVSDEEAKQLPSIRRVAC